MIRLSEVKTCQKCGGDGWVCENHPDKPWYDGDSCCGAAGMPCTCHPLNPAFKAPRIYEKWPGT